MARPRKNIDGDQVIKLAAINCSYAEIAAVCNCNVSTLQRRFALDIEKGRQTGKSSLKRKMWESAMGGNITMMIWLSKQMLGYSDKISLEKATDEALSQEVQKRLGILNASGNATNLSQLVKQKSDVPQTI